MWQKTWVKNGAGSVTSWDLKENILKIIFENYKPLTKLQVLKKVFAFFW